MSDIAVGSIVWYAEAPYEVAAVNGDLLTLDGVSLISYEPGAGYRGDCRPRVTVLAGDVTRVGEEESR